MFSFFNKTKIVIDKKEIVKSEDFTDITPISEYFKDETGVTFEKQASILKNKVTTFCRQRNIYSFVELLNLMKNNADVRQELINYLTTNETFFYREFTQIKELVALVKKLNSKVDILCAPSATGEEPYSIVIALLEAGVNPSSFHITGIDINSDVLHKANDAVYRDRNVRNLSPTIINKYFTKDADNYSLKDSVKSLVTFKLTNLFDSSFKHIGKFDFIFSRNMLIYFDKPTKQKAKEILENMRKNKDQDVFFGHADLF